MASIRPVTTNDINHFSGGPGSSDPGRVSYTGISLRDLVGEAYTESHGERVSGPSWLDSKYALALRYPPNVTWDQFMAMLGTLLSERFHLVFHRVPKDISGYELVVAPGGPKLMPADPNAKPPTLFDGSNEHGFWRMTFRSGSMGLLAGRLARLLSPNPGMMGPATVLVVDKTGLHGGYNFHFDVEKPVSSGPGGGMEPSIGNVSYVSGVLRKQLGLKLNPAKIRIDYVVVDHADKAPSPN